MPYQRRYTRRRYRKPAPSRWTTYGNAGKQLFKDVMYLKSIVNAECKSYEGTSSYNFDDAGDVLHITPITMGDAHNTRDGDVVLPSYFTFRMNLAKSLDALASDTELLRVILFIWHDISTPNVTSVLETANVLSFYQRTATGSKGDDRKFTIIADKKYTFDKLNKITKYIQLQKRFNKNGKERRVGQTRRPMHIKFNGSNTTNEMNGIYAIFIAETPTASSDSYKISGDIAWSIKFYDN